MQYFVMKKAKELNCKVMLDGQGGDETLLGYEKYYPSIYIDVFRKHGLIETIKEVMNSSKNNNKMNFWRVIKYTFGYIFSSLRKKEYQRRTSFLKPHCVDFKILKKASNSYFNIIELQKLEIQYTNLPALLRYEDKNSMRHSIETRLPFIDYKTLQVALSINSKHKINDGWTKYIIR